MDLLLRLLFVMIFMLIVSEDSDVSTHTRRCCTSGSKEYVIVGGFLQRCSDLYQRNDTIQCAFQIPNSLTGVSGILNCCPDITKSFYLGSGVYPCSTHLIFPAVTAHALFEYCPSSSLLQSENLPAMNNPNNGELLTIKFHFFMLVFTSVSVTGTVV